MTIARVALPVAVANPFDYWVPDGTVVRRGSVVRVHLGARRTIGVVLGIDSHSDVERSRLQPIDDVVELAPLPEDVVALGEFIAAYYREPAGLALANALPPLRTAAGRARLAVQALELTAAGSAALQTHVRRSPRARALLERFEARGFLDAEAIAALESPDRRRVLEWRERGWLAQRVGTAAPGIVLNDDQRRAVEAIVAARGTFAPLLLQGVTGSGKTAVYAQAARAMIAGGGQVLMLVPEINLTPQLAARLSADLPGARIAVLHSALSDGERREHWRAAAAGEAQLVVGTRLAVFAPLPNAALIVVDEEHDPSYKQQDGVRYHARDAAVWRARERSIPIVLGSATPSLESFAHAEAGRYRRLVLAQRADPLAAMPKLRFVPDRDEAAHEGVSGPLWAALAERLARGEQSLVFVNRRGYAPSLKCSSCSWEAGCTRCAARLVVHRAAGELRCHHCGHAERIPRRCPECGNVDLAPRGFGTERLEGALRERFASARIARVDRDTTRIKGSFEAVRTGMEARGVDILVGTQMLAKGHDFPRLTLVGVLGADNALYSADFRATERLAALLFQVAGRAGRAELPGEVIVQTAFARHPVYTALALHDYDGFARTLLAERAMAQLPPSTHLVVLAAEAHLRSDVDEFLGAAERDAQQVRNETKLAVDIFGPVPAMMARKAGFERAQLVIQSPLRPALQRFLDAWQPSLEAKAPRRVRWSLDVDPASL